MASAMPQRLRCDQTTSWPRLQDHAAAVFGPAAGGFDLRQAFATDPGRFARFSQQAPQVFADLSKNLIDDQAERLLLDMARECGLEAHRDAMYAGEAVNTTEGRAALHTLLRCPTAPDLVTPALLAAWQTVVAERERMLDFAEQVRADARFTDIVNLGIGGSDLGPQTAVLALDPFVTPHKRFHFVSNGDGDALAAVLATLEPATTLFLVASKTFTTVETMGNTLSVLRWFHAQGGSDVARHFVALSADPLAGQALGMRTRFALWDWVGGRYSLWSAIGMVVAMAIGAEGFRELLSGAHAMDRHFHTAPLEANLPVRLGLLDVWQRNFLGFSSRNVAPYCSALRRLPAHLQQLEMESNGKRVDMEGQPLTYRTAPVVWGEPGMNGQHAYFQMLLQGTEVVPVEFIAVKQDSHRMPGHHRQLLASALAQAQALMLGETNTDGHRHFPGNRPSSFLLLETLTPRSLGALLALYEHRVFVAGSVWGINSFDQHGVELGKVLARGMAERLASGDTTGLDASSAGLLQRIRGG